MIGNHRYVWGHQGIPLPILPTSFCTILIDSQGLLKVDCGMGLGFREFAGLGFRVFWGLGFWRSGDRTFNDSNPKPSNSAKMVRIAALCSASPRERSMPAVRGCNLEVWDSRV